MKYALIHFLSIFSVAATLQGAVNIVVDFETPDVVTTTVVGTSFEVDGYTITSSVGDLAILESDAPFYSATQSLFAPEATETVKFERADGSLFSAATIHLDGISIFSPLISVQATYENGETLIQNFSLDAAQGFEGFAFDQTTISGSGLNVGFKNIESLELSSTNNQSFQIDNFTATAVPEPSSALLLGVGALAFSTFRRRNHCVTV